MKNTDAHLSHWKPGEKLLEEFEVIDTLGRGGMGEVYLVRRLCTNDLFAVKTTRYAAEKDDHREHLFLNELRVWLDLPDYPHLNACRFFRTIDDRIVIFAEYVEGQSLRQWIRSTENKTIELILDIAIQFAWGLHAAHTQKVVHQDVKPDNVLLTHDLTVKVTDFGLSRARQVGGISTISGQTSDSSFVCNQGMTLAYCSPEQALIKKLTFQSDIWSYGLSILLMLTGKLTWRIGTVAADILDMTIMDPHGPDIPSALVAVLRKCFQVDPRDRWQSVDAIACELQRIYEEITCSPYPRVKPVYPESKPAQVIEHDRLTVSGRSWDDPMEWLKSAFKTAELDTDEIKKIIPSRTGSRFSQAIVDLAVFNRAIHIFQELAFQGCIKSKENLGLLYRNKALVHRSIEDLPGAIRSVDKAIEIWEELLASEIPNGFGKDLAKTHTQKASLLAVKREYKKAIEYTDKALSYFQNIPRDQCMSKDLKCLAEAYQTKADALWSLRDYTAAIDLYDKAIALFQEITIDEQPEIKNDLAKALANKGNAILGLGKYEEAIELYDHVITIRKTLLANVSKVEMDLAKTYFNKSVALSRIGDQKQRLEYCNMAISITQRLVTEERRREYLDFLSLFYMNKAGALTQCECADAAMKTYDQAIEILERQYYIRGRNECARELSMAYTNKANIISDSKYKNDAIKLYNKSLRILEHLIKSKGHIRLKYLYAEIMINKGDTLREIGELDLALKTLNQAIKILIHEIDTPKRNALLGELGWARLCKTKVLLELNQKDIARNEAMDADRILKCAIKDQGRLDLKEIHLEVLSILETLSQE